MKLSMRIELVELTELLSVLEDVDEAEQEKPCALWQIIIELKKWMATGLPNLLDEHRAPGNWSQRLEARIEYLRKLDGLCAEHELDPALRAGFLKRWKASKEEQAARERRFTRVNHTLQDHLEAIMREHAKVMDERSTADLLCSSLNIRSRASCDQQCTRR